MNKEQRSQMLCLIRSKACKKCGGDLSLECDVYGVYIQCIQCGANWSKEDIMAAASRVVNSSRVAVPAKASETSERWS
jgi:hypothetical protein